MAQLPCPDLDDRHFQDLVDEAKRYVQQRCPEWTDHNVSDPGVTLIELFATMVDQVVYRLNRVPDRHYVKFLELLGLQLLPPRDARTDVTFWLSAALPDVVPIPVGTEVATLRTEQDEAIAFQVTEDLDIVPCELLHVGTSLEGKITDCGRALAGTGFDCFSAVPRPGDALVVGLDRPVPRCAVALRFDGRIEGVGVDPTRPPIVWEAWTGVDWARCAVDRDETGGLNRPGDVVIHVPAGHVESILGGHKAAWLRCRVAEPEDDQPVYSSSPRVVRLSASTIGGTARAGQAEVVDGEIIGFSNGVAGQRFRLRHRPVVRSTQPVEVEVATESGWEGWTEVRGFSESSPTDPHFTLDAAAGEIALGPAVREADGSLRHYGAVPPKGAALRVPRYRSGGGRRGNVARGAITVLKSSIPYVGRVENRAAAAGGVDAEDIESAKVRGPIVLRSRNRAVTAEDYEELAREACSDVARVRCVPAAADAERAVRVLVVPAIGEDIHLGFEQLVPSEDTLATIAAYLDERRVVGVQVIVEPPVYQGITVVARLRARPGVRASRLTSEALAALERHFHPVAGGDDGRGWPFGRAVHIGEVYAVLQSLPGTEYVEEARIFPADPITGRRGTELPRLELGPNALVFSYEHQVHVEEV